MVVRRGGAAEDPVADTAGAARPQARERQGFASYVPLARHLLLDLGERAGRFRFLVRDRDGKFTAAFDEVLAGNGTPVITTPVRSPQADAFAERFAGTLRTVVAEYAQHCNRHRPHQGLQQGPSLHQPGRVDISARIEHRRVVVGLISEHRRAA